MRTAAILIALLALAGCATGESYRTTTVTPTGDKTVFEAKRTGIWFAGQVRPLTQDADALEIK